MNPGNQQIIEEMLIINQNHYGKIVNVLQWHYITDTKVRHKAN